MTLPHNRNFAGVKIPWCPYRFKGSSHRNVISSQLARNLIRKGSVVYRVYTIPHPNPGQIRATRGNRVPDQPTLRFVPYMPPGSSYAENLSKILNSTTPCRRYSLVIGLPITETCCHENHPPCDPRSMLGGFSVRRYPGGRNPVQQRWRNNA